MRAAQRAAEQTAAEKQVDGAQPLDAGQPVDGAQPLDAGERTERLGSRAVGAVMWSAGQRWVVRLTGFATALVLTRMLSPGDFGTVAIAMSLLPVIYLLADMGFSTYVVQAESVEQRMLSTAFWFTTGAGAALAGILALSAPVVAWGFDVPGAQQVVYALIPPVVLVTLTTVPMALLRRRMQFRALAVQSICAAFAGQAVAVIFALRGMGVWALIAQTIVNQCVVTVFAWHAAKWRPSAQFSVRTFREMAAFGGKVVGVEFIATTRALVENAIITASLGVTGLGYVNVAQRLMLLAQDVTAAAIVPVSTVVFAQVRSTADRLRSAYVQALGTSLAILIPGMVFLAVTAPALVPMLFGDQWGHSVAPSQILAVAGVFVLGAMLDHGLFYGTGKPGRWLVYAAAVDVATVATAAFSAPHGVVTWAFGFLGVAVLATVARWPLVANLTHASWRVGAQVCGRALLSGAADYASAWATFAIASDLAPSARILLTGAATAAVHLAGMTVFMRPELTTVTRIVASRAPRVARSRFAQTQSRGSQPEPATASTSR